MRDGEGPPVDGRPHLDLGGHQTAGACCSTSDYDRARSPLRNSTAKAVVTVPTTMASR
jgi:hypothetical protein